jgi:16S rRNA (guanine527-N7)-methyltransferase
VLPPTERARLLSGAADLGIALEDAQLSAFDRYVELLLAWNQKINLTTVTELGAIVEKHLLDSLAVVPALKGTRVIDVGTGPGLPSVVLAIARPELVITAVESIHKKVSFVRAVARELRLPIVVRPERLENLKLTEPFELAVSRATFEPAEWVARGAPLVGERGRVVAMLSAHQAVPNAPSGFAAAPLREYRFGDAVRRIASYDREPSSPEGA